MANTADAVLAAMGALLPRECRIYDTVARWGGEEFVVALPDTTLDQGIDIADRIRNAVAEMVVHGVNGDVIPLTVSIGVAVRRFEESQEALLDRADCAMYAAKTGGRNRTCASPDEDADGETGEDASPISYQLRATG